MKKIFLALLFFVPSVSFADSITANPFGRSQTVFISATTTVGSVSISRADDTPPAGYNYAFAQVLVDEVGSLNATSGFGGYGSGSHANYTFYPPEWGCSSSSGSDSSLPSSSLTSHLYTFDGVGVVPISLVGGKYYRFTFMSWYTASSTSHCGNNDQAVTGSILTEYDSTSSLGYGSYANSGAFSNVNGHLVMSLGGVPDSITPIEPYAQTYLNNPVPFRGTYESSERCYKGISFDVESLTYSQNVFIPDIAFNSCPVGSSQVYSSLVTLPHQGNYRSRARLVAFDEAYSTPWSPWVSFALGTTTSAVVPVPEVSCVYANTVIGNMMTAICQVSMYLFVPSHTQIESVITLAREGFLSSFPFGYVSSFVALFSDTTVATTMPSISYTFGSSTPLVGATYSFDLFTDDHMGKLATIYDDHGDGKNLWDIVDPWITTAVAVSVVLVIITDLLSLELPHSLENRNRYLDNKEYKEYANKQDLAERRRSRLKKK